MTDVEKQEMNSVSGQALPPTPRHGGPGPKGDRLLWGTLAENATVRAANAREPATGSCPGLKTAASGAVSELLY